MCEWYAYVLCESVCVCMDSFISLLVGGGVFVLSVHASGA